MKRVVVGLDDQAVTLVSDGDEATAVLDFVCRDLVQRDAPNDVSEARLVRVDAGAVEAADAAEALMRDLAVKLLWDYASGLALHAAAIEVDGRLLLFPASSGTGKSTLSVYLAGRGMKFCTDELVLLSSRTGLAHALARPAHLKPGSLFLLSDGALHIDEAHVRRYAGGALIAPRAFLSRGAEALPLGGVVFPCYSPGAALALETLSSGAAAFALLGALVNARNLPESGVPETARVASSVKAYRLTYSSLAEGYDALVSAFRQTRYVL